MKHKQTKLKKRKSIRKSFSRINVEIYFALKMLFTIKTRLKYRVSFFNFCTSEQWISNVVKYPISSVWPADHVKIHLYWYKQYTKWKKKSKRISHNESPETVLDETCVEQPKSTLIYQVSSSFFTFKEENVLALLRRKLPHKTYTT